MKKAQGQIITTILIILLVLAAIVIVWQVVNRTVSESAEEGSTQSDCIGSSVTIESATGTTVSVRRNAGGPSDDLVLYAIPAGQNKAESAAAVAIGNLGTITVGALTVSDEVKAGVILADGTVCNPIAIAVAS